jgi:hypothetical protein
MRNAARYRERWLRDFYRVGKDAVRERKPGEPFAFLIPPLKGPGFWQTDGQRRLLSVLTRGGVEVIEADSAFNAEGKQYPAGTKIVAMTQPYGSFAKTLLERQKYPDLREYPGGPPRRPYDVTAHTLPLLMGVNVVRIDTPFNLPKRVNQGPSQGFAADAPASPRIALYRSYAASMDEGDRWVFDHPIRTRSKPTYTSVTDADLRTGS